MSTDLLPQYGTWTVLGPAFKTPGPGWNYKAPCRCACGTVKDVNVHHLRAGLSKGCLRCRKAGRKPIYPPVVAGTRFKRLTALGPPRKNPAYKTGFIVDCRCDCGNEVTVQVQHLQSGRNGQCDKCRLTEEIRPWRCDYHLLGVASLQTLNRLREVHGGMLERCYNPKHKGHKNYGGRGIDVVPAWRDSVAVFLEWAVRQPGHDLLTHSIDRIDNNKGYAPENCRFATDEVQLNNKRNNVLVTYRGETFTASRFLRAHCPWCSAQAGIQYLKRHSTEDTIEHYRPGDPVPVEAEGELSEKSA